VARIEELAAKLNEAKRLRQEAHAYARGLLLSAYARLTEGAKYLPMGEVAPLVRRPVQVGASKQYHELGIRSFGNGTFHKPSVSGAGLGTKKIFHIEAGDLLFNIVFAWEGAVAVARKEDHGRVGSHRFLTCVPKSGLATAPFLCFHFLTERGLERLAEASPGGAGRNRTLGLKALERILVPVPPFEKQRWFGALQAEIDCLKHSQAETTAEHDALLPSILDKAFRGEL
jgi:type I restriction enzyme S subunit